MFIVGDKNLPVYEVEMNCYNPLTNQLEHKWVQISPQCINETLLGEVDNERNI